MAVDASPRHWHSRTMIVQCPRCKAFFKGPAEICPFDDAELAPVPDRRIGRVLARRYRLDELIGVGGMSSVYRARHVPIGRDVAIKVLDRNLSDDPVFAERFLREARATNLLRHQNIVEVHDIGEDGDLVFLVMDLLTGEMLADRVERGPIPPAEAVAILLPVASALARAHSLDVVHRDIKPENVFLCDDNGRTRVRVLDFGIAHVARESRLTATGQVLGTPGYMAPELIAGLRCSPASDLYSLGVMAYEMLSGVLPFQGSPAVIMLKHLHEAPPSLSAIAPGVQAPLAALIMALLAKDPAQRPASADAVMTELLRLPPDQ